jgi:chromate transporter
MQAPAPPPPSLWQLFLAFFRIGAVSFGGGMSAWMRREMVQKRGWLDDRQFLAGLALAQISPGANGVNLAVFIGTQLRGLPGALASFAGLVLLPTCAVLGFGALYFASRGGGLDAWVGKALTGVVAAATGLVLANGVRLARRNAGTLPAGLIIIVCALAIGWARLPLLAVLAVMLPLSLLVARMQVRR